MYFVFVGLLAWNDKVSFMRMVDCRTGDERDVDLEELAEGLRQLRVSLLLAI